MTRTLSTETVKHVQKIFSSGPGRSYQRARVPSIEKRKLNRQQPPVWILDVAGTKEHFQAIRYSAMCLDAAFVVLTRGPAYTFCSVRGIQARGEGIGLDKQIMRLQHREQA